MTTHAANDPKAPEPLLDLALPVAKIRGEPHSVFGESRMRTSPPGSL